MAVIGPYMDAAEAAASVAQQLEGGQLELLRIEYLGEIANHESGPLRAAAVAGVLGRISAGKITIVNAEQEAALHGLRVDEDTGAAREPYANLVVVRAVSRGGETAVAATRTPQGVRIVGIDGFEVDIARAAAPWMLAVENLDRPGMIGKVGGLLGDWSVNVNFMSVAAGAGGRALMALGIDRPLDAAERRRARGPRRDLRRAAGPPGVARARLAARSAERVEHHPRRQLGVEERRLLRQHLARVRDRRHLVHPRRVDEEGEPPRRRQRPRPRAPPRPR